MCRDAGGSPALLTNRWSLSLNWQIHPKAMFFWVTFKRTCSRRSSQATGSLPVLNQSQGESRRVAAVGSPGGEHAARLCDGRIVRAMALGCAPGPRAHVPRADSARARAVARALAGGARLVGGPGGRGAGARPAHDRRVARRVRSEWSGGVGLRADRRLPPALDGGQQARLKAAIQAPPREAGLDLADWNWKVVREFVRRRFGITLGRSSCRNYLHRLGFVLKRPKKRLLQA